MSKNAFSQKTSEFIMYKPKDTKNKQDKERTFFLYTGKVVSNAAALLHLKLRFNTSHYLMHVILKKMINS